MTPSQDNKGEGAKHTQSAETNRLGQSTADTQWLRIGTPRNVHRFWLRPAGALQAPISTRVEATGAVRGEESESASDGPGRRFASLVKAGEI